MPEIIVKYKNAKALKALKDLAKIFDIVIENPVISNNKINPPIIFAKNPDFKALAGIWEGKNITLEELRKKAWGDRV